MCDIEKYICQLGSLFAPPGVDPPLTCLLSGQVGPLSGSKPHRAGGGRIQGTLLFLSLRSSCQQIILPLEDKEKNRERRKVRDREQQQHSTTGIHEPTHFSAQNC